MTHTAQTLTDQPLRFGRTPSLLAAVTDEGKSGGLSPLVRPVAIGANGELKCEKAATRACPWLSAIRTHLKPGRFEKCRRKSPATSRSKP